MASGDEIGPEAILLQGSAGRREPVAGGALPMVGRTVADVERALILDTLQHTLGNRTHAATILGISIRTLRNKLRQYGERGRRGAAARRRRARSRRQPRLSRRPGRWRRT